MKTRSGFVSNSSTTAFIITGWHFDAYREQDRNDFFECIEKFKNNLTISKEEYLLEYEDDVQNFKTYLRDKSRKNKYDLSLGDGIKIDFDHENDEAVFIGDVIEYFDWFDEIDLSRMAAEDKRIRNTLYKIFPEKETKTYHVGATP